MEVFFLNLIKSSFIASLVILLVITMTPFVQKRYAIKWRYWLWLLLSIMLIIPLNISLPNAPITIRTSSIQESVLITTKQHSTIQKSNDGEENIPSLQSNIQPLEEQAKALTVIEMAMFIWMLGGCLYIIWHMMSYYSYKRTIQRWSYTLKEAKIMNLFNQIKGELNVSSKMHVKICSKVNSPMLMGLWRPIIILPNAQLTHNQLRHIFEHELTHYIRHDIHFKMLLFVVKSLHWFNPFIHRMSKMASSDIEKCCDACVLQRHDKSYIQAYIETIIAVMKLSLNREIILSTNFKEGKKSMMARIKTLIEPKKHRQGVVVLSLILLTILIIQGLIGYSQTNEESINKRDELIEVTDKDITTFIENEATPLGKPIVIRKLYDGKLAIVYWKGNNWIKYYEVYKYKNGKISSRWLTGYSEQKDKDPFTFKGGTASGNYPYTIIQCNDDEVVLSYSRMLIKGEVGNYSIDEKENELYIVPTRSIGSVKSIAAMGSSELIEDKIMEYDFDTKSFTIKKPITMLPPFEKQTNDKIESLAYQAAIVNSKLLNEEDVCIVAPKISGSFEVDGQLKIFATICSHTYSLEGDTLVENGGSNIPTAIIYKMKDDGTYILEDYILAKDGSFYRPSIEEFTAPHRDIAKEMVDTQDYIDEQQQLMMDNVKEYVEVNKHLNIRYIKDSHGKILVKGN